MTKEQLDAAIFDLEKEYKGKVVDAQVITVSDKPSEKLKYYTTSFGTGRTEVNTKYGKALAIAGGFVGTILTEKKPEDLKKGSVLKVKIIGFTATQKGYVNKNTGEEMPQIPIARAIPVA